MKITTLLLLAVVALALGACKKDDGPGFDGKTCKLTRIISLTASGEEFGTLRYYSYQGDYVSRDIEYYKDTLSRLDSLVRDYSYEFDGQGRLTKLTCVYNDTAQHTNYTTRYQYYPDSIAEYRDDGYRVRYVYQGKGPHFAVSLSEYGKDTFRYKGDDIVEEGGLGTRTWTYDDKKKYIIYPEVVKYSNHNIISFIGMYIFNDMLLSKTEGTSKYEYNSSGYPIKFCMAGNGCCRFRSSIL